MTFLVRHEFQQVCRRANLASFFFSSDGAGCEWASWLVLTDLSQAFAGSTILRTCKVPCGAKNHRMYIQNCGESRKFALLRDGTREVDGPRLKASAASVVLKLARAQSFVGHVL